MNRLDAYREKLAAALLRRPVSPLSSQLPAGLTRRLPARLLSLGDLLATAWPLVLLILLGFALAFHYVKPAPPSRLVISAGPESGAYYGFAQEYARILARDGITVEVRASSGAAENLQALGDWSSPVEAGFVQGGMPLDRGEAGADEPALHSLGSLYYEPVWVFYRSGEAREHAPGRPERPLSRLTQLAGKRVAIGGEGEGVRTLALQLLEENEILKEVKLENLSGVLAAEALQQGKVDAAFVIAAPEAPVVQVLLRSPGVRLMGVSQADAYVRRFPFLFHIVLPQGGADIARNFPPRDTHLIAATANLVVRDSLHPALVTLLLQAMAEVHGKPGFFNGPGVFPSLMDHSLPASPAAERYYRNGPPFLQRYLPYWAAVLVDRALVLLLPVLALLIPILKVAPALYTWRIRSGVFRAYGELKFLELELREHYDPTRHGDYLQRLQEIEEQAFRRRLPLAFLDLQYTLRGHIALVRRTLMEKELACRST